MNKDIIYKILEKIEEYDRIIIFRHSRPDGDAVGSTKGLREILRLTYPKKEILLINHDFAKYTEFLGDEDADIDDALYAEALGIVIDTGTTERISNKKFSLCRELIKIDHHIDTKPYGDISWVEEERSSSCEMIAHFYNTLRDRLKINVDAATYIYAGMVTDSGRFRFRDVSGDTMRLAGMLLDLGIDTDTLFAHLYMKDYHTLKFQSYVYENMQITDAGVVYIYIDRELQERFGLSQEEASAAVSYMESIKNCLIWLAFIENGDGSTRVRLRSRFVTVSEIAERYSGGGHACAAGATVYSRDEAQALIGECDARLAEYKRTHEGWL